MLWIVIVGVVPVWAILGLAIVRPHVSIVFPVWLRLGGVLSLIVTYFLHRAKSGNDPRVQANIDLRYAPLLVVGAGLVPAPFWINPYGAVSAIGALVFIVSLFGARRSFLRRM